MQGEAKRIAARDWSKALAAGLGVLTVALMAMGWALSARLDEAQARVFGELVRLQAVKAQRQPAPEGADEQKRAKADAEQGDPPTSFHLLLLGARRTPPDAAAYDAGKQG